MATYYGVCRSNYFKVKDADEFKKFFEGLPYELWTEDKPEHGELFGFGSMEEGFGNIYVCSTDCLSKTSGQPGDCDCNCEEEVEPIDLIAPHLADGWICEVQEAGFEKLRYLVGCTTAFNNKGETQFLDLNKLRKESDGSLGEHWTDCSW